MNARRDKPSGDPRREASQPSAVKRLAKEFEPLASALVATLFVALVAFEYQLFSKKQSVHIPGWIFGWANPASAQAWFAFVLVVVTIFYAKKTYDMAQATARLASLQERQQDLLERQQRDTTLPVIVFVLDDDENASIDRFTLLIHNAGNGPAIDVFIDIRDLKMGYDPSKISPLPIAIPKEQNAWFNFVISPDCPFDPSFRSLRFSESPPALLDATQQDAAMQVYNQRRERFDVQARTLAGTLDSVGTVVARYKDIHGRESVSEADLIVSKLLTDKEWPRISIGPMRITLASSSASSPDTFSNSPESV